MAITAPEQTLYDPELDADLDQLAVVEPALAQELRSKFTLATLIPWFRNRGLPLERMDGIAQDEFSHDLLIPLDSRRWLVFGIT